MEVTFTEEIKSLRLKAGETFHGEGILAITKALLQSGVAYVGGYQGAPVSHFEGASVIQERIHAYALKSSMCLLNPRPDLPKMVDMVEPGFRLSETSNMPVILELRIRACHVRGSFVAKDTSAQRPLPVAAAAHVLVFLEINPKVPLNNIKEFLEYAKKNPGKLTSCLTPVLASIACAATA